MQVRFLPGALLSWSPRGHQLPDSAGGHQLPDSWRRASIPVGRTVRVRMCSPPPVLPSAPLRGREHARSTDDPGADDRGSNAPARARSLDAARVRERAPVAVDRSRDRRDLDRAHRLGPDPAQLRRLWLARVGLPDAASQPRPWRRTVVEASAVPVHGALRAVRPLPAVAVDDHGDVGGPGRSSVRGANRVPSHRTERAARRPAGHPPLRAVGRGGVRRGGRPGARGTTSTTS